MSTVVEGGVGAAEQPASDAPRGSRAGGTLRFVVRRVLLGLLTIFLVSGLVFWATQLLPGDAASAILGPSATPEKVAALRAQLGLDRPVIVQYLHWLAGILHLDFGVSLTGRDPVATIIGWRTVNSLSLLFAAAVVAVPLSILLGTIAAVRPGRVVDHVINLTSVVLAGIPEFVTALVLVVVFSTTVFHLFPAVSLIRPGQYPLLHPQLLVLPVATLTLAVIPYLSRLVRGSLVEALNSDYVTMAQLKGLAPSTILLRHAMRNGLVPAIQGTALTLGYLLGGVVVVEFIFAYPGLGSALQQAVLQRDLPVIQAIVMLFALGYVLFNLLADLLTVFASPRLSTR